MKQIERIEMKHWTGWSRSVELQKYEGSSVSVRILKKSFLCFMQSICIHGLYYFRVRRVGGTWKYFTIDM